MSDVSAPLPEEDDLLAAELAFGLLDAPERQAALARLEEDGPFAAAHARWQAYAAAMLFDCGEAPRPSVWTAILARLPENENTPENKNTPANAAANDDGQASSRMMRRWRAGAIAASLAALVLGGLALRQPEQVILRVPVAARASAPMVAVLAGKQGFATVSFDPASGRMVAAAGGLALGAHAPELWVIPADGKPRPMGVIEASGPSAGPVPAAAAAAMAAGVTIAISVEPLGGSTTGLPTGPVILSGKLQAA